MKYCFSLFLLTALIYSCSVSYKDPKYINKEYFHFEDTLLQASSKSIHKIQLFGMGISPTRFFIDNVSNQLVADFKLKGIEVNYTFLGSDSLAAINLYNRMILNNNSDVIMTLFQADSAVISKKHSSFTYLDRYPNQGVTSLEFSQLRFKQGFNIQLFNSSNLDQLIWSASLNVNFDFKDISMYKTISNKIIASFTKDKLCN